jgi:hypothetical protein
MKMKRNLRHFWYFSPLLQDFIQSNVYYKNYTHIFVRIIVYFYLKSRFKTCAAICRSLFVLHDNPAAICEQRQYVQTQTFPTAGGKR